MLTFIDADSLLFKVAATERTKFHMRQRYNKAIEEIKSITFAETALVCVKGAHKNFRYDLYPEYKGKRPPLDDKLKENLNYIHGYAVDRGAIQARDGWEADDEVSEWVREAYEDGDNYVISHIDKDLDMLPGTHHNYNKDEFYDIDLDDALYNFYHQLLTGDSSDNIPGVSGVGKVKATRALDGKAPTVFYNIASNLWKSPSKMERSARLLFMGDPDRFTWDLRELYDEEKRKANMEAVSELLEEGEPVLPGDDLEDRDGTRELLRDERHSEELEGPEEGDTGNVSEEESLQVHGTDTADIQSRGSENAERELQHSAIQETSERHDT